MVRGRIEITPSEQLAELRKARDRYAAIADHLKANPGSAKMRPENRKRERDARRIADAYDKSITNMTSKMMRVRPASASWVDNIGMARPLFALALGVLALLALLYPGAFETRQLHAGPVAKLVPAASANAPQTAPGSQGTDLQATKLPAPNPRPPLDANARRAAAGVLRPTPVAEQVRPVARAVKPAARTSDGDAHDGFVTKVLQPDGTLKEEYFPASAPR